MKKPAKKPAKATPVLAWAIVVNGDIWSDWCSSKRKFLREDVLKSGLKSDYKNVREVRVEIREMS